MKINIEKAKEEFIKYTENYDLENEHIEGKQQHSLRVMQISRQIAERLKLSEDEIELATLIGLLHDIARFEQYTQYKTFRDLESIDHGDYGVEILNKDIRKYVESSEYDAIIKLSIKNHNKYQIQEGLTEQEKLFAKIVRDADKIDIFYESVEMFWKGKEKKVEEAEISERVLDQFYNNSMIKREKGINVTPLENVISVIAFIYDINFKESFQILKEEDYVNKILNRYQIKKEMTRREVEKIRKIANEYIGQKENRH